MKRHAIVRIVAAVVAVLILSTTIVIVTQRVTHQSVDPLAISTAVSLKSLSDQRAVILHNLCESGNAGRKKDLAIWQYLAVANTGPVFVHAYALAKEKDRLVDCATGKKLADEKAGA